MTLFAELIMTPGGVFAWIVVGLLGGWLAGLAMSGGGYGIIRDVFLGLIGAGGWRGVGILHSWRRGVLGKRGHCRARRMPDCRNLSCPDSRPSQDLARETRTGRFGR